MSQRWHFFEKPVRGLLYPIGIFALLISLVVTTTELRKLWVLTYKDASFPLKLPSIERTSMVVFQPNYTYWNMSSPASRTAWEAYQSDAAIFVKNPSRFGLPPGIEDEHEGVQGYAISLFHQIHCLENIRNNYAAFLRGERPGKLEHVSSMHVEHCFDYLRQAIMCAGDLTLEKAKVDPDGHRRETEGWDVEHQCIPWNRVMEIVDEYRMKYVDD